MLPLARRLIGASLLLFAAAAARSQEALEVQSEVQLESAQEARLQAVLRKALATEDVLVIVDMGVSVETRSRLTEVLPGVPAKDSPAAADIAPLTRATVKSINATVYLDDSLPAEADSLAQKTSEQVLGLDLARGDAVTVKRMRLRGKLAAARPAAKDWLTPGPVVSLLWLFGAFVALALVYGSFLKPLMGVLREIGGARAAPPPAAPILDVGAAHQAQLERHEAAVTAAAAPPAPQDEELPFAFLRERHEPMLRFLLRRAPAKTAAVIVHYLPPRMAVGVLGDLPAETRAEVAKAMSRVTQLDEENVRQIEDSLRARIDYLMGGEDKLAEILDQAPPALQDEMLAAVRGEEPETAERLGRRIVRITDLGLLDAEGLKTLSRRVPIRSLATVLASTPEVKAAVLPKLTAGLGAWLGQEIELAASATGDKLAAEQKRVLAVLSQLVKEGAVRLERGAPRPAQPALPEPPDAQPAGAQG